MLLRAKINIIPTTFTQKLYQSKNIRTFHFNKLKILQLYFYDAYDAILVRREVRQKHGFQTNASAFKQICASAFKQTCQ